jgi:8-oxo-dGTP pyrophosphatase MutT (NUDIX family)
MMQKYEVFIDDGSISFEQGNDIVNKQVKPFFPQLKQSKFTELKSILNSNASPLFVYAENPEKSFKTFFSKFKWIEAAGGLVRKTENHEYHYLFIERLGHLDLPKGKLEKLEDELKGAKREIQEECGISGLELISTLPCSYHAYFLYNKFWIKKTHWFLFDYHGDEVLTPQTEEDITNVFWLSAEDIQNQLKNSYASLKNVILTGIEQE